MPFGVLEKSGDSVYRRHGESASTILLAYPFAWITETCVAGEALGNRRISREEAVLCVYSFASQSASLASSRVKVTPRWPFVILFFSF